MTIFDGRQIMITGGVGDIGLEVAKHFIAKGASVVLADINAVRGLEKAEELGSQASFVQLDVTGEISWQNAMQKVTAHKPLYGLINAAGIFKPGIPFTDLALDIWRQHFNVNLDGTFMGCRFAMRAMAGLPRSGPSSA